MPIKIPPLSNDYQRIRLVIKHKSPSPVGQAMQDRNITQTGHLEFFYPTKDKVNSKPSTIEFTYQQATLQFHNLTDIDILPHYQSNFATFGFNHTLSLPLRRMILGRVTTLSIDEQRAFFRNYPRLDTPRA